MSWPLKLTKSQGTVGRPTHLDSGHQPTHSRGSGERPAPSPGSPFSLLQGHRGRGLSAARAGVGACLRYRAGGGAASAAPVGRAPQSCSNTTLRPEGLRSLQPAAHSVPAAGGGHLDRRAEDARVTAAGGRAGEGSGPRLRRRDPKLGRRRACSPGPAPLRLASTSPGHSPDPEAHPATKAAAPHSFVPHLRPAVRASSPAPRAPSGHAPTRAALTGRRFGPPRPRGPPSPQTTPSGEQRSAAGAPAAGQSRARRLRSHQHQFPSVVRAAPRKCHQRPFRSAPHFRPEPQSSACWLERPPWRREPMLPGRRPGASCAAPSGGGDARARPSPSAGSSAPASRAFARASRSIPQRRSGRDEMPGQANPAR